MAHGPCGKLYGASPRPPAMPGDQAGASVAQSRSAKLRLISIFVMTSRWTSGISMQTQRNTWYRVERYYSSDITESTVTRIAVAPRRWQRALVVICAPTRRRSDLCAWWFPPLCWRCQWRSDAAPRASETLRTCDTEKTFQEHTVPNGRYMAPVDREVKWKQIYTQCNVKPKCNIHITTSQIHVAAVI